MKRWLCAIGLALCLGCATAVVRPYVGDQQSWPVASGSIVNTSYALPIFTSLPPVPYDIIAEMRISSPFYAQPEEHHLPILVERAQQLRADALLFVQGKMFFSTNYGQRNGAPVDTGNQSPPSLTTVNTFNPESFAPDVTILAIRWIGEPPPGLSSHNKAATTAKSSAPAPAATAPAPVEIVTPAVAAPPPDASQTNAPTPAATPAPSTDTNTPAPDASTNPSPAAAPTTNP